MSRKGMVSIPFDLRRDSQAIRKNMIMDYRDQLRIGQDVEVTIEAVVGDSWKEMAHRKFRGKIKYIHTNFIVVDTGNWRTSFTYAELMQNKTKVKIR